MANKDIRKEHKSSSDEMCMSSNYKELEEKLLNRIEYVEKNSNEKIKKIDSELQSQRSTIQNDISLFKSISRKMIDKEIEDLNLLHSMFRNELDKLQNEFSEYEMSGRAEMEADLKDRFNKLKDYQEELKTKQETLETVVETQIGDLNIQHEKIKVQQNELSDEQEEFKNAINNFYSNIVAIIGLLVATFSIIGINLNVLPTLNSVDGKVLLLELLIVNFSLMCSLFFIFYLYSKFVRIKNPKPNIVDGIAVLVLFVSAGLIVYSLTG